MKKLTLLIAIIFQFNDSYAQQLNIKFNHLNVQDGLSQSWVRCIYQDRQGFMWFGTYDGLNKYDGYTLTSYYYDTKNRNSLNSSNIETIYEDIKGNLWISTKKGLNQYDRTNDQFIHNSNWPQEAITDYLEMPDGRIYLTTRGKGLLLFDPDSGVVKSYIPNSEDPFSLCNYVVEDILEDSQGNIWIGAIGGLVLFNSVDEKFITFRKDDNDNHSLSDNSIFSLLEDKNGRIWVGTVNNGLNLLHYEPHHPERVRFTRFVHNPEVESSISPGAIMSLLEDDAGYLWIGTQNGGLDVLDLNDFQEDKVVFDHYRLDPFDNKSLSNNSVYSIFKDCDGGIWLGTYGDGINYYHPLKDKFAHIKHDPNNPNSLNNNFVNTFYEEGELLWIGTEGGINLYNKKNGSYRHFVYNPKNNRTIGSNAIWSIYRDSSNNLWFGTWAGGLNLFDSKNSAFTRFTHDDQDSGSIPNNNVFGILEDRIGNLWIGAMGSGLYQFNYKTRTFKSFNTSYRDNSVITNYWINTIFKDSFGKIWISTAVSVDVFEQTTGTYKHFKHDTSDAKSISDDLAIIFFEDSQKNLWIGTSNGLNVYNRTDNNFDCYTKEHGLPNNQIKGILEDARGNLWLSTNKGISKFIQGTKRPEKPVFKNYDLGDGLQGNEFTGRSCWLGQDGRMYFGGNKGFNVFHPDSIRENTRPPEVVLTNFLLFNKTVDIDTKESPLKSHIGVAKSITLSHTQSVISFEYAALDYIAPEKNQYAYSLEGFEKEWNYVGNKRRATYTNLDPGEYTFHVKASNNDGYWNETGTSIQITILPPWWQTWWFRALSVLFIVSSLIVFYLIRVRTLRSQKLYLEKQVKDRTNEIEHKNIILSKQASELNDSNVLLEERQEQIEEQTEELQVSNEKLSMLNATKDKFFSIIAHDLKNPFSSILGFCEVLLLRYEKYDDSKRKHLIGIIDQSAQKIYKLLENLLEWARSQTGNIKYTLEEFEIEEMIRDIIVLVDNSLNEKGLKISYNIPKDLKIYADKNMIYTVIRNLVTNAIKFTEAGEITIIAQEDDTCTKVSVIDTGIGIRPEVLDKIFEIDKSKSTEGTRGESGTGLGLILCKEFVENNKGTIHVESEEGKGSTFYFTLPIKPE